MTINTNEWLTTAEAQAYLKVSKATLYRYINAGKIKTSKIIGRTLVSKASIDSALMPQQ